MKKYFLKDYLLMIVIAGATTFAACNNADDPKEVAEERNDEDIDDRKGEKDAQFLVEAADLSLMEVHMGLLGSTNATMAEVKEFGKKMEMEHQKVYDELSAMALAKNIALPATPSEDGMKDHQNLTEKTGYDFDRKFCDDMIDSHQKAINKFEKAADGAEDAEIKNWAASKLPELNAHLAEAKVLKEKVKDMK